MALELLVVGGNAEVDEHERSRDVAVSGVGVVRRELLGLLTGSRIAGDRNLLERRLEHRRLDELDDPLLRSRKENVEALDLRVPSVRAELVANPLGVGLVVRRPDVMRSRRKMLHRIAHAGRIRERRKLRFPVALDSAGLGGESARGSRINGGRQQRETAGGNEERESGETHSVDLRWMLKEVWWNIGGGIGSRRLAVGSAGLEIGRLASSHALSGQDRSSVEQGKGAAPETCSAYSRMDNFLQMSETLQLRTRSIGLIAAGILILFTPGVSGARTVAGSNVAHRAMQEEVRGRVVDSAGAPIANAVVSLAELRLATKTAADGTFSFGGVPAGRYTLVARRVGYAAAVRDVVVSGATDVPLQLAETPFQVEPVTVTATRSPTSGLNSSLPTSALSEDELRREASISLSHSLRKLPGVRSLSTGEQIGKPMIRGLFGSRVLVLENGSRLEDYSWSDEDAPSVDARLAQRVEVIRGPASVLYGSDALGGVVNVVPEDLPSTNGGRGFHQIGVEAYGATNNHELGSALKISGASGRVGWRLFGVGRYAEAYRTPDGEVDNTGFFSANGEAAVGLRGTKSNTSLRFSHYGGEFKLLEAGGPPPGTVDVGGGPERKLSDDRLQLTNDYLMGGVRLETKAQFQRHSLIEISDDTCRLFPTLPDCIAAASGSGKAELAAFDLLLNTGTVDVLAHHTIGEYVRGTAGVSGLFQTNDSKGPIFLVPDATVGSVGAFAFEEATQGDWTFSVGGRIDTRHLTANRSVALGLTPDNSRSWTVTTGNAGAVFRPLPEFALAANAGISWRAPTLFELYSNGPLLAEGRYEIGDKSLDPERAFNLDLSARWEGTRMRGEITAFRNDITNFIYLAPTAERLQGLEVFRHRHAGALLTGGELSAEFQVSKPVTLKARHDFVRGTNRDLDEPLPLMAPARSAFGVDFRSNPTWASSFFAGGEAEYVARQNRPNPDDFVTASYTLLNFDIGIERDFLGRGTRLEVGVRNAADVRYRSFLSRYKEFALEPGRNIIIGSPRTGSIWILGVSSGSSCFTEERAGYV